MSVRLNLVLGDDVMAWADDFGKSRAMSLSSVVRHAIVEWMGGGLDPVVQAHPTGRRVNLYVPRRYRAALEAQRVARGHPTVSALVEALLRALKSADSKYKIEVVLSQESARVWQQVSADLGVSAGDLIETLGKHADALYSAVKHLKELSLWPESQT